VKSVVLVLIPFVKGRWQNWRSRNSIIGFVEIDKAEPDSLSLSILLLTVTAEDNNYVLAQSTFSNQSGNKNNNTTSSIEGLGYDTKNMTHYSAKQEWQPHLGEANSFVEWWYVTTLLHDAAGNQYMLLM
jgi:hypothetical protein